MKLDIPRFLSGQEVDVPDCNGQTPLMLAAQKIIGWVGRCKSTFIIIIISYYLLVGASSAIIIALDDAILKNIVLHTCL